MFLFIPFNPDLDRKAFTCGNAELDAWLREHAGQQERSNNTRTTLGVDEAKACIASYFSLVTHRIEVDEAADTALGDKRRYPIPTMLLARLAVHSGYQGQGFGTITLFEALRRLTAAALDIGFEAVVVDAIDDTARAFYEHHGFRPLTADGRRLYLTTGDLRATFESEGRDA